MNTVNDFKVLKKQAEQILVANINNIIKVHNNTVKDHKMGTQKTTIELMKAAYIHGFCEVIDIILDNEDCPIDSRFAIAEYIKNLCIEKT